MTTRRPKPESAARPSDSPAAVVHLHVLADSLLPPMRCDRGCDYCCTWAPASEGEYARALAYAAEHGVQPRKQGMLCPWYQDGVCAVHPVRPLVCRVFGHSPALPCIRGYNTNVRPAVERRLLAAHKRLCPDPELARYLHEVVYSRAAVERMLMEQEQREWRESRRRARSPAKSRVTKRRAPGRGHGQAATPGGPRPARATPPLSA